MMPVYPFLATVVSGKYPGPLTRNSAFDTEALIREGHQDISLIGGPLTDAINGIRGMRIPGARKTRPSLPGGIGSHRRLPLPVGDHRDGEPPRFPVSTVFRLRRRG